MSSRLARVAALLVFGMLATANSGGYRYGVSDQAFYVPAVARDLDPALFPKDAPLLAAQARLALSDEVVAGLSRMTRLDLPGLFFALYVLTLAALGAAALAFARSLAFSGWASAALLMLLTFRHRIAKTGANSLEGYFHPRELAFACGIAALAAVAAERRGRAWLCTALAAVIHPTTALWFAVAVAAAEVAARPRSRSVLWTGVLGAGVTGWAVIAGPLRDRLVVMDPAWLAVLSEKDYLFPAGWPLYAWIVNLACPAIAIGVWRLRERRGVARASERTLAIALATLLAVFVISVPLTSARLALAVQLQVTRVFWVMDFAAVAYLAWLLIDGLAMASGRLRALAVIVLAAGSLARGAYLLREAGPDRRLIAIALPDTPWIEAMRWLDGQPASWHVLADPGHAWKYGVSVRLAARKDTLMEQSKDSAVAIYDRSVAMRIADRADALAGIERMTAPDLRRLAARYQLDVAVVERGSPLDLPVLHQNARFIVYDLR